MLLAIDVGNTHTVFGIWDGHRWVGIWRRSTDLLITEDEIAVWLRGMFDLSDLPWGVDSAICGSVVPAANDSLVKLCERWLKAPLKFLRSGHEVGLEVTYDPPAAVGADRIANALAALQKYGPPIVVVDFGTATTFDSIGPTGAYLGGAILPGVALSSQALFQCTAKLPQIDLRAPDRALGRNTVESLQSGIMLGYAGAIDTLARRISAEMGGNARVIATGGLGSLFFGLCQSIEGYEPTLTLEGLLIASERLEHAGSPANL